MAYFHDLSSFHPETTQSSQRKEIRKKNDGQSLPRAGGGGVKGRSFFRGGGNSFGARSPPRGGSRAVRGGSRGRGDSYRGGFSGGGRGRERGAYQGKDDFGNKRSASPATGGKKKKYKPGPQTDFWQYLEDTKVLKVVNEFLEHAARVIEQLQLQFDFGDLVNSLLSYLNKKIYTSGFPYKGFEDGIASSVFCGLKRNKHPEIKNKLRGPQVQFERVLTTLPDFHELERLQEKSAKLVSSGALEVYVTSLFSTKTKTVPKSTKKPVPLTSLTSKSPGGPAKLLTKSIKGPASATKNFETSNPLVSSRRVSTKPLLNGPFSSSSNSSFNHFASPAQSSESTVNTTVNTNSASDQDYERRMKKLASFDGLSDAFHHTVLKLNPEYFSGKLIDLLQNLEIRLEEFRNNNSRYRENSRFQGLTNFKDLEHLPYFSVKNLKEWESNRMLLMNDNKGKPIVSLFETEREDIRNIPKDGNFIKLQSKEEEKLKTLKKIIAIDESSILPKISVERLNAIKKVIQNGSSLLWSIKGFAAFDESFLFVPIMENILKNSIRVISVTSHLSYYTPVTSLVRNINPIIYKYLADKEYRTLSTYDSPVFKKLTEDEDEDKLYVYINIFSTMVNKEKNYSTVIFQPINLPEEAKNNNQFCLTAFVSEHYKECINLCLLEIESFNELEERKISKGGRGNKRIKIIPILMTFGDNLLHQKFLQNNKMCQFCESFVDNDYSYTPFFGRNSISINIKNKLRITESNSKIPNILSNCHSFLDLFTLKVNQLKISFKLLEGVLMRNESKFLNEMSKCIKLPIKYCKIKESTKNIVNDVIPPDKLNGEEFELTLAALPLLIFELSSALEPQHKLIFIILFEFFTILKKSQYSKNDLMWLQVIPHLFFEIIRNILPPNDKINNYIYTTSLHQLYHTLDLINELGPLKDLTNTGVYQELDFVTNLISSCRSLPLAFDYKLACFNNIKLADISTWQPESQKQDEEIFFDKFYAMVKGRLVKINSIQSSGTCDGEVIKPGKVKYRYGITADEDGQNSILFATIDLSSEEEYLGDSILFSDDSID